MKRSVISLLILLLCFPPLPVHAVAPDTQESWLEMKVKGVTLDPYGNTPIVVLEDTQGHQAFPIWIGIPEAQAIARIMEGTLTPRPMTHALLKNILTDLQVKVARIVIHDLRSNTFYALISLQHGSKTFTIDARPSDALTLALAVKAPIFVAKKVLESVRTVTLSALPQGSTKKFGMHLQSLDANLAEFFHLPSLDGVLVSHVETGSPAERYGMRHGDVITTVDGRPIKGLQDFLGAFEGQKAQREIVLQVTRGQHSLTIHLFSAPE